MFLTNPTMTMFSMLLVYLVKINISCHYFLDYIQTWVKSEQPECTLNAIYCQEQDQLDNFVVVYFENNRISSLKKMIYSNIFDPIQKECSVTSVQRGTSPPICEDSEDCLSPSGVCFESVSAYEVNLDGERRNVISLIYGCATQVSEKDESN